MVAVHHPSASALHSVCSVWDILGFPESLCGMQTPWQPLEAEPTGPGAPEITVLKSGSFELGTPFVSQDPPGHAFKP